MYKIYGLICPIRKTIRYIGVTSRPLEDRLKEHLQITKDRNPYRYNWIQKLKRNKKTPGIVPLAEYKTEEEAYQKEVEFIKFFRKAVGKKLTNISDGGSAPPNWAGKKHTSKSKKKMAKAKKAKPVMQFDSFSNTLLAEFKSAREASRMTGVDSGSIIRCCKEKRSSAGGFLWSYAVDLEK